MIPNLLCTDSNITRPWLGYLETIAISMSVMPINWNTISEFFRTFAPTRLDVRNQGLQLIYLNQLGAFSLDIATALSLDVASNTWSALSDFATTFYHRSISCFIMERRNKCLEKPPAPLPPPPARTAAATTAVLFNVAGPSVYGPSKSEQLNDKYDNLLLGGAMPKNSTYPDISILYLL